MSIAEQPIKVAAPPLLRIAPPRGWLNIDLAEIWAHRELLYFFVWRDLKVRYKQTAIGAAWVVLQPFITMLIFTLFFGKLAKIPSQGLPYPIFYYCGLLPWAYFASALQRTTNTVVDHQHIITKVYFPRLLLPVAAVLSPLVDFAISLLVFSGMMIYYRIHPGPAIALLPVFLLLAMLTAFGVGLWLSTLNALYRDVGHILPFVVQFWMFASPIIYPSTLVPQKWRWLYGLNPLAGVIEGVRWSLTGHGQPPNALLLASAGAVIAVLVGGAFYFQRVESTIADVV